MTKFSKLKIGLILISLFIIAYIYSYERAFYKNSSVNKWQNLSWNDFEGVVKPFSPFDASIHSNVYVEYDSMKKEYKAYSGQNNVRSWKRKGLENDTLLLRHEQYHFNITEYHARLMNKYLKINKIDSEKDYQKELNKIHEKLNKMQDEYDKETNHSIIVEQQEIWENKVDSLMGIKKKIIFTRQWIQIEYEGRTEEVELYISNKKDTVQNQFKFYLNGDLDYSNSQFYELQLSKTDNEDIYKGTIKYYSEFGFKSLSNRRRVKTTFDFLEKTKDSSFFTKITVDNSNEINFEYQNKDNNALSGMIRQFIEIDTIIDHKEMVRMIEYGTLVDNYVTTPSIDLIVWDFIETRKFSLKRE